MSKTIYIDRVNRAGVGSAQTVYLSKVPVGKILHVEHLAACIYTTTPGDYTTSKFIWIGFEIGDKKYYLNGHDINATNSILPGVVFVKNFTIPEGARLFAYFEATATSTEYELAATGIFTDVEDWK